MNITPQKFYQLVSVYRKIPSDTANFLDSLLHKSAQGRLQAEDDFVALSALQNQLMLEVENSTRERIVSEWSSLGEQAIFEDKRQNLIGVAASIAKLLRESYSFLHVLLSDLKPTTLLLGQNAPDLSVSPSFERLQQVSYEMQSNQEVITRFVTGIEALREGRKNLLKMIDAAIQAMDVYHNALVKRHYRDGTPICCNSVLGTDLALSIYANVDRHGEIEAGTYPDKVSAYSVHKASLFIEATFTELLGELKKPGGFRGYIQTHFTRVWDYLRLLEIHFQEVMQKVFAIVAPYVCYEEVTESQLQGKWEILSNLDPESVLYKDPGKLMSPAELLEYQQWITSLEHITQQVLRDTCDTKELVHYVLQRKAELRRWQQEENSFYVCRIGSGNQFRGIAPGALEVIPGIRPNVKLEEILGSGFDEVREFTHQVESASKWHDLFVATSPSRTADKSNVLLIGPMGCGKTQVLRAVGCDTKSVGIFASGSDFNTCWLGEATKNPKRLFQEGLRIQKESGKHVHFLIDEIDAILNNDRQNAGYINLTLEFQILMDGVVNYPNLSVWGTTNNPQRIPMPMIRRFSKVLVVGELDQADRVKLLQHFMGFLPLTYIADETWQEAATKLEGATGDVIRKVVDAIWRETMTSFVQNQPQKAEELAQWLSAKQKFSIAEFTPERKRDFQSLLRRNVAVSAEQFMQHVDKLLENVAILHEIETAKLVYENARVFLSSVVEDRG